MGKSPSQSAMCLQSKNTLQDNEEKSLSKIRRMLFRVRGHVTQPANMRATAKQRGCDRGKSDKFLRVCPFDHLSGG